MGQRGASLFKTGVGGERKCQLISREDSGLKGVSGHW